MPLLSTIRLFFSIFMLVCIWVCIVSLVVLGSAYFAMTTMRRVLFTRPIAPDPLDAEPLLAADTSYGSLDSPTINTFSGYRASHLEDSFRSASTHSRTHTASSSTGPSPLLSSLDDDLFISPRTHLPSPPLTIASQSDAGFDTLHTRLRSLAKTHNSLVLASPPRKKAASDPGQHAASRRVPLSRTRRASRPFSAQMLPECDAVQSWEESVPARGRPVHKRSYSLPPAPLLDGTFSAASTSSDFDSPIPGGLGLMGVRQPFAKHARRTSLNLRPLSLASVHPCPGLGLDA